MMKRFLTLCASLALATNADCVGCDPICIFNAAHANSGSPCDVCNPLAETPCGTFLDEDEALHQDCAGCYDSIATDCSARLFTEVYKISCIDYCVVNGSSCAFNTTAVDCEDCEVSTDGELTSCENDCENKRGCVWDDVGCTCECSCLGDEDRCQHPGCEENQHCGDDGYGGCMCTLTCLEEACNGCTDDTICEEDGTGGGCNCRFECGNDNPSACGGGCAKGEICEEAGSGTECVCRLECDLLSNPAACEGGCTSPQVCVEHPDGATCMCAPDCAETPQECGSIPTDCGDADCVLDEEKLDCICDYTATDEPSTTNGGQVAMTCFGAIGIMAAMIME